MQNNMIDSEDFHYCKIKMSKDGKGALILGYRIELTKSEYIILNALLNSDSAISRSRFESEYGLTYSSVAVHVSNINRKVLPITNRKLIDGCGRGEYRISDTM